MKTGKIPESEVYGNTLNFTMMHYIHKNSLEAKTNLGWLVLPDFQRPLVWTEAQMIRFIESAWLGYDIGRFAYVENEIGEEFNKLLIDGQQRMTAIFRYINDEFKVFGYLYSELDPIDHSRFNMISMPTILIKNNRWSQLSREKLLSMYNRMNYGGTPHSHP